MEEEIKQIKEKIENLDSKVNNWNLFFLQHIQNLYQTHKSEERKNWTDEEWFHFWEDILDRKKWLGKCGAEYDKHMYHID